MNAFFSHKEANSKFIRGISDINQGQGGDQVGSR